MKQRERYIIQVPETVTFAYALSKARRDVEQLAVERGYKPFPFCGFDSAHGDRFAWIRLGVLSVCDWLRLLFTVNSGSIILLQYPHLPMKSAPIARFFLPLIARVKHCTFIAFIHDLDSLRAVNGAAAVYSDTKLLRRFQTVVCHNERMQDSLLSLGVQKGKISLLFLFDYLCDDVPEKPHAPIEKNNTKIAFAGNLAAEKSGFLCKLPPLLDDSISLLLYGSGYCEMKSSRVQYQGVIPSPQLPAILDADFGLVWDGDSTETCNGAYGKYLALNNPHKVSLYLAAGIPIIIWSGAALAGFVTQNGLGVAIDSLSEIPGILAALSEEAYRAMRVNAQNESRRVRSGYYLNRALNEVEADRP